MSRRFGSRRRSFGGARALRKMLKWTGQQLAAEATQAAAGQTNIVLVAPSDYEGGTTAGNVEAGGATLYRIRGDISLRATVIGGLAYMAIYCIGANETAPVVATAAGLVSGDLLWSKVVMVPIDTPRSFEIDVRVKRKLENDQIVFCIFAAAQTVTYLGNWRCLIRSSG